MKSRIINVLIFTSLFLSFIFSQQSNQSITIDMFMSKEDQETTGISSLSYKQRKALDEWFENYTFYVMNIANTPSTGGGSNYYVGVGGGHWISKKSSGGEMITLEDRSMWEIHSMDKIYTMLWLPITNITVLESNSAIGDYRYILYNTDDGEKALAKYLGK